MSDTSSPPLAAIHEVRSACLCLATQRAARRLARRFDRAFQPFGLTNGQFSALMFLAAAEFQTPGRLAELMAMDRTTVTALCQSVAAPRTRRGHARRASTGAAAASPITPAGRLALTRALPVWRAEHAALEAALPADPATGRAFLQNLSAAPLPA